MMVQHARYTRLVSRLGFMPFVNRHISVKPRPLLLFLCAAAAGVGGREAQGGAGGGGACAA